VSDLTFRDGAALPSAAGPGLRARIHGHVRSPLTRSGYALLLSSAITSVLGLAYWFLAARLYEADELGRGAALVSAMLLVTSLATAGLKRGLIRFVPTAGAGRARLVLQVYGAGIAVALAFGGIFLVAFRGWSDKLDFVRDHPLGPALFLLGVAAWGLFVLQDAVLIGARRAAVVPVANAVFSVAKIATLVGFLVMVDHRWGVFLSWLVPALGTAVVVNAWLFGRGLRSRDDDVAEEPATVGQVVRFTSGEYVASLLWQTAIYFTPLLVLARAGATANAHYYLASQLAYALFLVSSNVTDALVAEGSTKGPGDLARSVRRAVLQISALLVPAVLGLALLAPLVMSAFGPGYEADAVGVLRLMALAAVPNTVSTVVVAICHVRQRLWVVIVLQATMAALTLGLAWVWVGSHGVVGAAAAWLVAQTVAAVLAVVLALRTEHISGRALREGLATWAGEARSALVRRRATGRMAEQVGALPAGVVPDGPVRLLTAGHDLLVVAAGTGHAARVVRLAEGRQGREVIAAHRSQLESLHADGRLALLRSLIPEVVAADAGSRWLVETAIPGQPASRLGSPEQRDRAVAAGLVELERIHGATARQILVTPDLVDEWVHGPVAAVAALVDDEQAARGLAVLHRRLTAELVDRPVTVARLHGDPSLDNLLFSPDGRMLLGIVDWETSRLGLPELDLIALVLSRRSRPGGELGEEVVDLLEGGWDVAERELLGRGWSTNAHVRPTTLLLLAWLGHVSANLTKTDRYASNGWWVRHNVTRVLVALADDAGAGAPARDLLAPEVDADLAGDADLDLVGPARRRTVAPRRVARRIPRRALQVAVALSAIAALAVQWVSIPSVVRGALVASALVVAPGVVLARRLGAAGVLARGVIGAGGAVAAVVLAAEALLYAGAWSPVALLAIVGAVTTALSLVDPVVAPLPPVEPEPHRFAPMTLRDAAAPAPRISDRWDGDREARMSGGGRR
jgi:O-antigen/teichoic acid export membrane protein/aminoglycoside phosphotransferase (APT) family kinase protein